MNCENNIKKIKDVVNSEEFYYQKLQNKFNEFKKYQISNEDINILIDNLNFKPFSFDEYLKNNSKFSDFILIIGHIVATSDLNGYNKSDWNLYEDKRVIAKAGVRQNDWTKNLLKYKLERSLNNLTESIKNAILYIESPENNLTQLSINHKKLVARNLLKIEFDEKNYFKKLETFFKDELQKYELKNQKNYGLLISLFLYCEEVKILWDKNNTDDKIDIKSHGEEDIQDDIKQTQPLNQILYGSPGTGKTYNTINKAIEIIDNKFYLENKDKGNARDLFKEEFKKYKEQGQIEFITFHQSYGYEEFVEGIKAKTNEETKQVEYEIEAGIFKKLCENAKTIKAQTNKLDFDWNRGNIFKMSLGGKSDSEILDWCLDNEYISMGWGNELDFSSITAQSWESFRDKAKSLYQNLDTDRFTLQAMYTFKVWMKKDDLVFVSLGNLKIVAIGQVIGDYEYKENIDEIRYSQFRKVKWLFIDKLGIPVEKLLNKKLSKLTIYNLDKSYVKKDFLDSLFIENNDEQLKNYVLIIDEINRGNISKIFGELITLIEPSKRIGADEEIKVKLPYSGEEFGVPQNLYIIGTMNTADRSIAPIDTALRRRFVFEEMAPNPNLLSKDKIQVLKDDKTDTGIELDKLLEAINTRIEYLYDRDHTIGHAYLIDVKTLDDLKFAFKNKIIPLLAEYFYEDWENIDLVLNSNGFIVPNNENKGYISKKLEERIRNKITYKVSNDEKDWEIANFKKIYDDSVNLKKEESEQNDQVNTESKNV
ncbi:AAA family ATPase [Aliarcobacter cryaerophilus]|uniref:AAA family ATPase n=1 Tax=Aliarcobacter cryaerophilus TaxID=28198 RepID=UPI0021B55DD7|nr:AAA family ATPase [Aliarcobacter cryaerophilus]MCT7518979.1 AAA family ATPase [Aliarcobacter cryaerophilus]